MEVGGGVWDGGRHIHPWLIHVNVWRKPPQYCAVISSQWKYLKKKKNDSVNWTPVYFWVFSIVIWNDAMQRCPSSSFFVFLKVMFSLPFFIFMTFKTFCLGWLVQCSSWIQRSLVLRFPITTPSCPLLYGLQKMHFLNARKVGLRDS